MAGEKLSGQGGAPGASSTLKQLKAEVTALERLDVELLRKRWRSQTGRPAPAHLSRALLYRILAYRLQTEVLGDINHETQRALRRTGAESGLLDATQSHLSQSQTSGVALKPGTLLAREYGGVMHRVMAMEKGYSWNGRMFRSLSEVALAITGTKWSGPRFFGLGSSPENGSRGGAEGDTAVSGRANAGLRRAARGDHASHPRAPRGVS